VACAEVYVLMVLVGLGLPGANQQANKASCSLAVQFVLCLSVLFNFFCHLCQQIKGLLMTNVQFDMLAIWSSVISFVTCQFSCVVLNYL
jgi:hypothetical protein